MRTSASCLTTKMKPRQSGFSLVELTVVLVLVVLASSIIAPNLASTYRSFTAKAEMKQLYIRLSKMGFESRMSGLSTRIESEAQAKEIFRLDASWDVSVIEPVVLLSNGVCLGGELVLTRAGFSEHVTLTAPFCNPLASDK